MFMFARAYAALRNQSVGQPSCSSLFGWINGLCIEDLAQRLMTGATSITHFFKQKTQQGIVGTGTYQLSDLPDFCNDNNILARHFGKLTSATNKFMLAYPQKHFVSLQTSSSKTAQHTITLQHNISNEMRLTKWNTASL